MMPAINEEKVRKGLFMSFFMEYTPGTWVRLPAAPDWGLGQVQSIQGELVTVNFQNQGKQTIHVGRATLEVVQDADSFRDNPAGLPLDFSV
jgi:hypothetical protein